MCGRKRDPDEDDPASAGEIAKLAHPIPLLPAPFASLQSMTLMLRVRAGLRQGTIAMLMGAIAALLNDLRF